MNLQQAKITLEKINRLYQSMTLDNSIDSHEQQLMLIYIRQLYKAFSGESLIESAAPSQRPATNYPKPSMETSISSPTPKPVQSHTPPAPEKILSREEPSERIAEPSPVIVSTPKEEVVVEEKVAIIKEEPVAEPVIEQAPIVQPNYTPPQPKSDPELDKINQEEEIGSYDELFQQQEAKELSERLMNRPITNLTKALSINDRILTCNELFAKDNNRFNEALIKLNSFGSFVEARPYLAELAGEFEWNNKEKKKRAQTFIKLVRRRYIA